MPEFFAPQFIPPAPNVGNGGGNVGIENGINSPNISNQARQPANSEQQNQAIRVATRGRKIKAGATAIITTRKELKDYLATSGIDLYTSAIDFQKTGDFVQSSYVYFKSYNGYQETLANFLQRYPQLVEPVMNIREKLRPVQGYMEVETKAKMPNYNNFDSEIVVPNYPTNYYSNNNSKYNSNPSSNPNSNPYPNQNPAYQNGQQFGQQFQQNTSHYQTNAHQNIHPFIHQPHSNLIPNSGLISGLNGGQTGPNQNQNPTSNFSTGVLPAHPTPNF